MNRRLTITAAALSLLGGALGCSMPESADANRAHEASFAESETLAASRRAFLSVYSVLMHPRCMNCHPAGDVPLQGDDSHLHAQGVKRGPDGKGLYALKCAGCHQEANLPGLNMPPGDPNWHLPSAAMPLVFQGLSPRELALQLKDPRRNGGKTLDQLVEHVSHDGLVLWGWNPGEGRTLPPLPHAEFVARFKEWVDKGAAVPD